MDRVFIAVRKRLAAIGQSLKLPGHIQRQHHLPGVLGRNRSGDDANCEESNKVILVVLSLILPPVAVFLKKGAGKDLIINIVLRLLFFLPGIVHHLWLILKQHWTSADPKVSYIDAVGRFTVPLSGWPIRVGRPHTIVSGRNVSHHIGRESPVYSRVPQPHWLAPIPGA